VRKIINVNTLSRQSFVKTAAMVIGLGMGALAGTAQAQPTMQSICKQFPCIYDAHGAVVGVPSPFGDLTRQIGSSWYQLGVVFGFSRYIPPAL
jgi:hypothetical protein